MKSKDGKTQDWPALVEQARRQVITTMETRLGITGLREKIVWEEVNTPLTWKEKFNLAHGSILGITHDFFNVLSFRPQSRHPSIKNAYFVGASAHPGTGVSVLIPYFLVAIVADKQVPIAIAGSRLCAEAVLSDLNIPLPSNYTVQASFPTRAPTSDLDRPKSKSIRHVAEDFIGTTAPYLVGMLVAWAVFMVYLELQPISYPGNGYKASPSQAMGGRGKETIAEMHASTPWTSTLAAMTALVVVFVVKSLASKVATKVGL